MELIVVILILLSGMCKGIQDQIMFHWGQRWTTKLNPLFWNPRESWRNKYKDGDYRKGPKFFGSTTFLVGFTDAWHLFGGINRALVLLALTIMYAYSTTHPIWVYVLMYIVLFIFFTIGFKFFYKSSKVTQP